MSQVDQEFPKSACVYERYDIDSLSPANQTTQIRILELGWTADEFAGKSVLDIGMNTGLLSIQAAKLGAAKVISVDVQVNLVDFFKSVLDLHDLPIGVRNSSLWALTSGDQSDIVLMMEVLHWIVDQGGSIEDAIAKLTSLTRETLYLETPWDIGEPSIVSAPNITDANYSMERILRALNQHFEKVEIQRFMTYFGQISASKRVLIKASSPRPIQPPMNFFGNVLNSKLQRGRNSIQLFTTPEGARVLKQVPQYSIFSKLGDSDLNSLCEYFDGLSNPTLVGPIKFSDGYRRVNSDGSCVMLFKFAGDLNALIKSGIPTEDIDNPLQAAILIRRDLRKIPEYVHSAIKLNSDPLPEVNMSKMRDKLARDLSENALRFCEAVLTLMQNYDRSKEDALIHNDLQRGNILRDGAGVMRVVDLDLIRTGPIFADLLCCAVYIGASTQALSQAVIAMSAEECRPISKFDIAFAASTCLAWLQEVLTSGAIITDEDYAAFCGGLISLSEMYFQTAN